jgi:hypothetical protein
VLTERASEANIKRIAGLGCRIEQEDELFAALDKLLTDPAGYGLFIMDVDAFGGLASDVTTRVPMIIFSSECQEQVFPDSRESPTVLRAPLSAVSLRAGFEHALRAKMSLYA